MAAIKFLTRSQAKKKTAVPLYLRLLEGNEVDIWIKLPTLVNPSNWSNKTGKFKQVLKIPLPEVLNENEAIDNRLEDLKKAIIKAMNQTGRRDREWLEGVINESYNPHKEKNVSTLTEYIQKYIDDATSGLKLTYKGKRFSPATLKSIKSFQTELKKYQNELKNKVESKKKLTYKPKYFPIDFDDITIDFYNDFVRYFNAKNYSQNTIGKHVKCLKTILKEATDNGKNTNLEFERKAFKAISIEVDNIYLDESELRMIYELDLTNTSKLDLSEIPNLNLTDMPNLEIARDIFLIGCWTCQRFSDYSRINRITILEDGTKVIRLTQLKTGTNVTIPIRQELYRILKKYETTDNEIHLPQIFEQHLNKRIKIIGQLAKINDLIEIKKTRGGMLSSAKYPKYSLITSHTARRSGCSNLFNAEVPSLFIMKLSGHKTEREFMKYLKLSEDDIAKKLSRHEYFIGSPLSIAQ